MSLTLAQLQALKSDIANDGTLSQVAHNSDGSITVANAYNLAATGPFFVWRTNVPVPDIFDQVTWTNYTPNDTPPASGTTVQITNDMLLYNNRALLVQIKQTNLLQMLESRATFDASKSTQRSGLQDATLNLPTGASGANRSGGWASILNILSRAATRGEKLFANTSGGSGASQAIGATGPATMVLEGNITPTNVLDAWNS